MGNSVEEPKSGKGTVRKGSEGNYELQNSYWKNLDLTNNDFATSHLEIIQLTLSFLYLRLAFLWEDVQGMVENWIVSVKSTETTFSA